MFELENNLKNVFLFFCILQKIFTEDLDPHTTAYCVPEDIYSKQQRFARETFLKLFFCIEKKNNVTTETNCEFYEKHSLETRLSSTLCLVMAGVRKRVWPRGIGGGSGGQQKFRANQSAVSMDTAKPLLALGS